MKLRIHILLILFLALWFLKSPISQGQPQTAIVVNNAETTAALGLTTSSSLVSTLLTVPSIVLHAFAESTTKRTLLPLPTALVGLLNQNTHNVLFAFSEASYQRHLNAISADLQARLSMLNPYTLFAFADASYERVLHYPTVLINDTTPPQTTPARQTAVGGIAYLQWSTSEFTTSILHYGTAPGVYTEQVTDELFAQDHFFNIMAFVPGQTYYVQITSKDRNGNEAVGNEFVVVRITTQNLYLPLIRKR